MFEFQCGYKMHERVIRPAEVGVTKKEEEEEEDTLLE